MVTKKKKQVPKRLLPGIAKSPTGIKGIDEITGGGLPKHRATLICGNAGCGKSLFATEFLVNGATQFNEPGLFISFEEREDDLIKNVNSLGFDIKKLIAQKKIVIDYIHINRNEFEEMGQYNLDGLFIRLEHQIKKFGIKRVAIDTIEVLFGNLQDQGILRSELQRLFRWLKDKKLTTIITAESGKDSLSRQGLEEYVADCVILLDHRIENQVSTRRLRVLKYRGSHHGTNEYPFLISQHGILVSPITSLSLDYAVSKRRISTGIERFDNMLDGKGFYEGSAILVSGVAGTGKSSFAAAFANSVCKNGGRCLYFSFEESVSQIERNMKSLGIDLEQWVKKNLLKFHVVRSYSQGLESHLVIMHDLIEKFKPRAVIIDPISNLKTIDNSKGVKAALTRLVDYLKTKQITAFITTLVSNNQNHFYGDEESISSLMDAWVILRNQEIDGELNRTLSVSKARGMKHSNQTREILLSNKGIDLVDVYMGAGKVLTGTARISQEAINKLAQLQAEEDFKIKKIKISKRCRELESKINALKTSLEMAKSQIIQDEKQKDLMKNMNIQTRANVSSARMADKEKE